MINNRIKKFIGKNLITMIVTSSFIFTFYTGSSFANNEGVVTTSKLNVRSGPSTSHKVIGSLSKNKSVKIVSSSKGWHKVKLSNKKEGWASGQYINTKKTSSSN